MKSGTVFIKILTIVFVLLAAWCALGQAEQAGSQSVDEEKAEKIIQTALTAIGGNNYLNLRTVVGRGFFTQFKDGAPQLPTRFVDYLAYPDKERTEFSGGGVRVIQANSNGGGWIFDGAAKTLKDQKPAELEDFKISMRTSVENLLHGWWRKENARLVYVGRREAGLAKRNETVRLTYPDGFAVEYEFGAKDGLPAKVIYKHQQKKPDTEEMEDVTEEDRLQKQVTIDGVTAPLVIDHYKNGLQTSRVNYESLEYNRPLADSLFAKPANIKSLK